MLIHKWILCAISAHSFPKNEFLIFSSDISQYTKLMIGVNTQKNVDKVSGLFEIENDRSHLEDGNLKS